MYLLIVDSMKRTLSSLAAVLFFEQRSQESFGKNAAS